MIDSFVTTGILAGGAIDDVVIVSGCPSAKLPRAVGRTATPDSNRPVSDNRAILDGLCIVYFLHARPHIRVSGIRSQLDFLRIGNPSVV